MSNQSKSDGALLSAEFYLAVLDSMPNLVFIKNRLFQFTYANQALADIFGTTKENIIGKRDEDFTKDQDQLKHFRDADRTVLLTEKPLNISEEFLTDAQGDIRKLATLKVPFYWPTKTDLSILGLATDITQLPAARTQADAMRLAIMSDLAHVIKSPIATAVFNLDAVAHRLKMQGLQPDSWWRRSRRHSETLATNIDFIRKALLGINVTSRTFAAIAQSLGNRPHETASEAPEAFLLSQLVDEQISALRQVVPSARLEFVPPPGAGTIRVSLATPDASLVKTAIHNIIHNAIKFSPTGSPIVIQLQSVAETATLIVKDSGIGICELDLPRVFDAGFTRRAPGHNPGTGMGLTVAKETFARLKWSITITSKVEIGTTVQITMPVIQ